MHKATARILQLLVLAILVIVIQAHASGALTARLYNQTRRVQATVTRVIDGDTIRVRVGGRTERVRLIGVDTPETSRNEKFMRDITRERSLTPDELLGYGAKAREFTEMLAPPGSRVGLEMDVQKRDRYGRLLAYVWVGVSDGGKGTALLNAELLKAGLAKTMTIKPDVKRAKYLKKLMKDAQRRGVGMWSK